MATKSAKEEKTARLDVLEGRRAGESIQLGAKSVVIGSDEAATFTCHDPDVEWSHARIFKSKGNKFQIEDLQSQGGVTVNDKKVLSAVLSPGDLIGIGAARFRFSARNGAEGHGAGGNGGDSGRLPAAEAEPPVARGARTEMISAPSADEIAAPDPAPAPEDTPASSATESAGGAAAEDPGAPADDRAAGTAIEDADVAAVLEEQRRSVAAFEAEASAAEAAIAGRSPAPEGGDMSFAEIPPVEAAAADDLSAPATVDDLIPVIEALREQNADLRVRLERAEAELLKKREGLSLATESFVDQLERAKDRISTFAKRHAETEAAVHARDEELEKLKLEHEALQQIASTRTKDLCEKIEAVRRDFDDLARVAASKGQHVAKIASEARAQVVSPSGGQALQTLIAAAQASGAGKVPAGAVALVPDDLSTSRAGGARQPSRAAVAVYSGGAAGAAASGGASTVVTVPAVGASLAPVAPAAAPGLLTPVRNLMKSEAVSLAAIFLIIAGAAFVIIWLFQMQPPRRGGQSAGASTGGSAAVSSSTSTFAPVKPSSGASTAPPPAKAPPVPEKKIPPKTSQAAPSTSPALPTAPQVAAVESAGDDGDAGPIGNLRKAHRARDEKAIKEAEAAIVARGKDILSSVREAYDKEKQFNVKVSLQFCVAQLEGRDSARDIIDAMRNSKAPDEKMRLAFMLGKLNKPEDVPFLSDAAQNESDPMIKKYIVRALGNVPGAQGLDVLRTIAQNNQDRNLRIESIRAIEERGSPESETFLQDLAKAEQDASIKSIAVRALATTGGRSSVAWFQGLLETDERTNNRAEATKFMSRVGEPADVPALEQAYQREKVYYIRQKIRQAIETIQRRNGIEPSPPPPDPQSGQPAAVPQPDEQPK